MEVKQLFAVILMTTVTFLSQTTAMRRDCVNDKYRTIDSNTGVEICVDAMWIGVVCRTPEDPTNEMDSTQSTTPQITPSATVSPGLSQLLTVTETVVKHEITTLTNDCKPLANTVTISPSCHGDRSIALPNTEYVTMTTGNNNKPTISLKPTPDVNIFPPTTARIKEVAPYIAVICILFCLLIVTFVGWVCTCAVNMRRLSYSKQRKQNSYNLQTYGDHDNTVYHQENAIFNQSQVETSFNSREDISTPHPSYDYRHHGPAYEQVTTNHGVQHMYDVINHEGERNRRQSERVGENLRQGQCHEEGNKNVTVSQDHSVQGQTQGSHDYHVLEPTTAIITTSRGIVRELNFDPERSVQGHTEQTQGAENDHDYHILEPVKGIVRENIYHELEQSTNLRQAALEHDYYELENDEDEARSQTDRCVFQPSQHLECNGHVTNSRGIARGMNSDREDYEVPNPSQTIGGTDNVDDGGYSRLKH